MERGVQRVRTDATELLEQFCVSPFSISWGYSAGTVKSQWGLLPSCENGNDKELQLVSGHVTSGESRPHMTYMVLSREIPRREEIN